MARLKTIAYYTFPLWGMILLLFSCAVMSKKTPESYYTQGIIESAKTNNYIAISLFTRAIKLKPDYKEAYIERADANMAIDSIENAIRDYDSLLVMKNITVSEKGEYMYSKAYAHYLLHGYDSTYCRLVNESCDNYGYGKACDARRIHCKK